MARLVGGTDTFGLHEVYMELRSGKVREWQRFVLLFLCLGWKFPPEIEKTEGFHPPKIRFYHPLENYYFPPGCVAYGVRKKKGCQ